MRTLATIAWRNIRRHPARSGVLLAAVIVGLWAGMLVVGWGNGLIKQRTDYLIEREVTHAQIHHPDFPAEGLPRHEIPDHDRIADWLDEYPGVESHASRTITDGMLQSPVKTTGVRIRGIDVESETRTTTFHKNMTEGEYLDTDTNHAVIMGTRLADEHNMRIGNRIVLTFENMDGQLTSGSFTVVGLFESASSEYDRRNVFVRAGDLMDILADRPAHHEIGILLEDATLADALVAALNDRFDGITARTWRQISPELSMIVELGDVFVALITMIVMAALGFGILNTMLMALFERMREIGMLLSIGMSRLRVFLMIMLESVILTLSGAVAGIVLAWFSIQRLGETGINLEMFAEGAALIGFDYLVYPFMTAGDYIKVLSIVIIITLLASLYPAVKAIRIRPLEATGDT